MNILELLKLKNERNLPEKYLRRVLLSLHSELNHYNKLSILSCTYRETWKRHNSLKKKKKKKERTTSDVTSTLKSGSSKH